MTRSVFMDWEEVNLRPIENDDAEFLKELIQHPDVRNTIGKAPMPVNLEQEKDYIEEAVSDDNAVYFLIEYEGQKAGEASIHGLEDNYRKCEFGISVHPEFHGKGVGTKTVQMLVKYAFDTLNMHKFKGRYVKGNKASKRIMEKAGMQQEGVERDYKYIDGEWRDVVCMSILEDEYYE